MMTSIGGLVLILFILSVINNCASIVIPACRESFSRRMPDKPAWQTSIAF